jgi:hypothetical protein
MAPVDHARGQRRASARSRNLHSVQRTFTRAAQEQFSRRKYAPATFRNKPVDVRIHVTINHVPVRRVKGACAPGLN